MIGAIALAALTAAIIDGEGPPSQEERFRLLYALGDKEGAYRVLLEGLGPWEIVGRANAAADWVAEAKDLDDLAHRIMERQVISRVVSEDPLVDVSVSASIFTIVLGAGDEKPATARRQNDVYVPVFSPRPVGVRSAVRGDFGEETVISWDASRVLIFVGTGAAFRPVMVPLNEAVFCSASLPRTPPIRGAS